MNDENILMLDLIYSKIGYILACLSSYSSLDLSKRIIDINKDIYLIKKSLIDNKEYVDIRNVISLREHLKQLKTRVEEEKNVALDGHKIACLLFEVSTLIKMLVAKFDKTKEDIIEYLLLTSEYLYTCGRIINIEILCFENIN